MSEQDQKSGAGSAASAAFSGVPAPKKRAAGADVGTPDASRTNASGTAAARAAVAAARRRGGVGR